MANKRSQRWIYIIGGIIAFIVLSPVALCGIMLAPTLYDIALNVIPWPTPSAMNLTYLPLPNAAITPGPVVTPDWENEHHSFGRELNSQVEIYTNRFGRQWTTNERSSIIVRIIDKQLTNLFPAYLSLGGNLEGRMWSLGVVFPWPIEAFTENQVHAINGATGTGNRDILAHDAIGPAGAEFVEWHPNPREVNASDQVPLATCRYQVHGHITLTSYSPVVGNFQFACQFDATEYALVSGWFWE